MCPVKSPIEKKQRMVVNSPSGTPLVPGLLFRLLIASGPYDVVFRERAEEGAREREKERSGWSKERQKKREGEGKRKT